MTAPVMLASRLDLPAAPALMSSLKEHGEADVVLDLADVTYLGALCLQVMLAAATKARSKGHEFSLVNISDRVLEQLRVMGITPEAIEKGRQ